MDQPKQRHHGGFARIWRNLNVGESLEQHLPDAVDLAPGQLVREPLSGFALLCRQSLGASAGLGARGKVKLFHEAANERAGIDPEVVRFVEIGERRRGVAAKHMIEQTADATAISKAEHVAHLLGCNRAAAMGDRLVQDRKAVARRAFRRPRDHPQRIVLDLDTFSLRNLGEMGCELLGRDAPQVEALGARQNRQRNLVHFGCREQEFHMLRRLLKSFQQRIECILGKHVDFVDDVDLVARADRRIADRVDDLADVVHTSV